MHDDELTIDKYYIWKTQQTI